MTVPSVKRADAVGAARIPQPSPGPGMAGTVGTSGADALGAQPGRAARARAQPLWSWRFLGAASLVVVLYYLVPRTGLLPVWVPKIVFYNGLGVSSVAAIVVGIRRWRPAPALAWYLFAAGLLSFAVADIIFYTLQDVLGLNQFPSVADVFYLASYPFMMGGFLLLIRARSPGSDRPSLIDALAITAGVGLASWTFLMVPFARDPGLTTLARLVSMSYPLMDLLLLATVVRVAVGGGARPVAFHLLLVSVLSLLCTDAVYSVVQLSPGGYHTGSVIDVGWMAWYACWGAAALHPSMPRLSEAVTRPEVKLGRGRLFLLAAASLMAPSVLALQWARHQRVEAPAVAVASALLSVLVLLRLNGLARQVAGQAEERKRLLDRTVQAAEEERARIAANLHDGPIQRLTGLGYATALARLHVERGETADSSRILDGLEAEIGVEVKALRQLMIELRPPVLDELGLPAALSDCADEFERRSGARCSFRTTARIRLPRPLETVLYWVAQEALTNVRKHACASQASVLLTVENGVAELRVSDDGVGFDLARTQRQGGQEHFGLAGMRQRVEMAGGTWEVQSHLGRGTTVSATLPLH